MTPTVVWKVTVTSGELTAEILVRSETRTGAALLVSGVGPTALLEAGWAWRYAHEEPMTINHIRRHQRRLTPVQRAYLERDEAVVVVP